MEAFIGDTLATRVETPPQTHVYGAGVLHAYAQLHGLPEKETDLSGSIVDLQGFPQENILAFSDACKFRLAKSRKRNPGMCQAPQNSFP